MVGFFVSYSRVLKWLSMLSLSPPPHMGVKQLTEGPGRQWRKEDISGLVPVTHAGGVSCFPCFPMCFQGSVFAKIKKYLPLVNSCGNAMVSCVKCQGLLRPTSDPVTHLVCILLAEQMSGILRGKVNPMRLWSCVCPASGTYVLLLCMNDKDLSLVTRLERKDFAQW